MNEVLNKFVDRLTDAFNKKPANGIYKLMELTAKHIQENEDLLTKIGNWRDIDQAEGLTLDLIGGNVQQHRGQAPDEVYRVLIKSKIKRNLSNGSINTLIDFISFILQIDKSDVLIRELWQEDKNATIHVNVPAGAINSTGLSLKQFGRLINVVVAAGIRAEVLFEGTFSFSSDYHEAEMSPYGFADDEGTIGGTLGYMYDPGTDVELPF